MSGCRVFIGHLSPHARERDVEKFFKGYGRIREIKLKNGFGFVVSISSLFCKTVVKLCVDYLYKRFSLFYRSLMTTETQTMLCMSWMEKSCVVKGNYFNTCVNKYLLIISHTTKRENKKTTLLHCPGKYYTV